jgi:uncharacterized protein DUF4190
MNSSSEEQQSQGSRPIQTSSLSIASLALAILSFFLFWVTANPSERLAKSLNLPPTSVFVFGIVAIPGVICGHLSLRRIRKSPRALGGSGLAIAGVILSYVAVALWLFICTSNLLTSYHQYRETLKKMTDSPE